MSTITPGTEPRGLQEDRGNAVIVGGSGAIGAACGHLLSELGFEVVLVARDAGRLAEVASGIPGARYVAADCGGAEEVERVFADIDHVGVLVHAAGIRFGSPIAEQAVSVLDDLYSSHLRSVFLSVQAALRLMSEGSRVVLVSSIASRVPVAGLSGYCAMKAGIAIFARSLSLEVHDRGIGVYVVSPGQVDTPLLVKRWHCLQPEDVAQTIGFLATIDSTLEIGEFDIVAATRGPHAPPLSGPLDGEIGTPRPIR
jgi:NAD(P)-dependent dehydrogenase (short-subunit alcohol dehydrogenase family)